MLTKCFLSVYGYDWVSLITAHKQCLIKAVIQCTVPKIVNCRTVDVDGLISKTSDITQNLLGHCYSLWKLHDCPALHG